MLVMGGFHLKDSPADEVGKIVQSLETLGTRWVAPTHYTGEQAKALFADRFGKCCLSLHPGSTITEEDLLE